MSHRNLFVMMIVGFVIALMVIASTVTAQATDPISLSVIQSLGNSHAAPALGAPGAHKVYLPLVIRAAAGAATSTPTRTATRTTTPITPAATATRTTTPSTPTHTPTRTHTQTASRTPTQTASRTPTQTTTPGNPYGQEGLFLNRTKRTNSASAAVDAAGGFHFAYVAYVYVSGHRPAYYAYCAATVDCGIESSWGTVSLSDDVWQVQLALTSAGHPRLLLLGTEHTDPFDDQFQYAACDVNCTNSANWTIVTVTTSNYKWVYLKDYPPHYFALDNQDRPRFLYQKTISDAYYVFCDADCTILTKWWEYPINADIFNDPTNFPMLTFTSAGQPRITALINTGTIPDNKLILNYITCDTACENLANWTYTPLMEAGSGHTSSVLRFNSSGQPRIVFNQGSINYAPAGYLYYWWCNNSCTAGANWHGSNLGAPGQAEDPDLALDALDRPRIAFKDNSPDGLGYVWCDTSCESTSSIWQGGLLEPSSDLDAEWPLPPSDCTGSYWYGGYRPSLALDPVGNPRIGYVAQHLIRSGSLCTVHEDYRAVRFIFFNKP